MAFAVWTVAQAAFRKLKPTINAQEMRTDCFLSKFFKIDATSALLTPCNAEEASSAYGPSVLHRPEEWEKKYEREIRSLGN